MILERREERRAKRSQKNTEKIKRPSSDKSKDVLCHALLTPLSSVRREEKNEAKRKWKSGKQQLLITKQSNK